MKILNPVLRLRPVLFALILTLAVAFISGCETTPPNSLKTHNSAPWEKSVAEYEACDRTNCPPANCILFYGSSSIRMWKTLSTDFPGLPVVNRGFGGSQIADLVNCSDRLVFPYHPKQIVIYAGVNDIAAGKPVQVIYGDFVALMKKLHKSVPEARLAYISCATNPSRWAEVEKVKQFNALAETYCQKHGIDFVDVFTLMVNPDGTPKPDIYVADRLHMNAKGYAIWRQAVRPVLRD